MSDSIDRRDDGQDGTTGKSLLSGEWPEKTSSEPEYPVTTDDSFQGASSMLEPANGPMPADGVLDSASEQNLRSLLKDVEKLRRTRPAPVQEPIAVEGSYVERCLKLAQAHYANQDFKASLKILHEGLKLTPGDPDILALAEAVRQASEQREAELEESGLADRIALGKKEAIELFEQGRYADCIERFKVLSELEPTNSDLRHYLEVSCEQAEKAATLSPDLPRVEADQNRGFETPSLTALTEPEPELVQSQQFRGRLGEGLITESESIAPAGKRLFEATQSDTSASWKPQAEPMNQDLPEYPVAAQLQQVRRKAMEEDQKAWQSPANDDSELPEDSSEATRKKFKVACLAGVGLVVGAMLGTWLALSPRHSIAPAETPIAPEAASIAADAAPPVALTEIVVGDPQAQAEKAFKEGKLLEANRYCDQMLQSDRENQFALDLKRQIRGRYLKIANQATADQKWADASVAWHNLLKVFPADPEAERQLKAAKANLKKEEQLALASKMEAERRIGELHQQITHAMSAGRHLPPNPGNAFELIRQLEEVSPQDTFAHEQRDEILRYLVTSTNRALQAKDPARATVVLRQIETYFPENPELKSLRDGLKVEQTRLAEAGNSWIRKAEAAMAAGHFVTPASDNAIAYCSELLAVEPQNAKALELKKASVSKAGAQAKAWVQEARFDDARAVYSALLYLPPTEIPGLSSSQEIKAEIEKLTFAAYAVVHDHALGSCTGRLRFNSYQVAYLPSSDSKDGFTAKVSEISQVESDDKLKIQLKGKTYRFHINGVKDTPEGRTKIGDVGKQLNLLAGK